MKTTEIAPTLKTLFGELINGPASGAAYILNTGDVGLLGSVDRLSASAASSSSNAGATIAAHTDHVRYGLSLMNRWSTEGGDPFTGADWQASWRIGSVGDDEWQQVRDRLREESKRWLQHLSEPREVNETELNGLVASIAHLAYHLGAIRQIDRTARGPKEIDRAKP
jgi:hypothetical protein